jgi:hypothetical protein
MKYSQKKTELVHERICALHTAADDLNAARYSVISVVSLPAGLETSVWPRLRKGR